MSKKSSLRAQRFESGPIWERRSEDDIDCPLCTFEYGNGTALAYLCTYHPTKPHLVGTHTYYCPTRQHEVPILIVPGLPDMLSALSTLVIAS